MDQLAKRLAHDPLVALVVDTCDLTTREVLRVIAHRPTAVDPLDIECAWRRLTKYLGPDQARWGPRFVESTVGDPATRIGRMTPRSLRARDLSVKVMLAARP